MTQGEFNDMGERKYQFYATYNCDIGVEWKYNMLAIILRKQAFKNEWAASESDMECNAEYMYL